MEKGKGMEILRQSGSLGTCLMLLLLSIPTLAQTVAEPTTEPSADTQTISELQPTAEEPLPPVPTKAEVENTGHFRRHLDFFGMNLGAGGYFAFFREGNLSALKIQSDVQLLNFRLDHLYFSILEIYPIPFHSFIGGGVRIGYRYPMDSYWHSEIRMGAALGAGGILFSLEESVIMVRVCPHIEYIHNTKNASVGAGIEIPIYFHSKKELEYYKFEHLNPISIGVGVYFHFSVGRLSLEKKKNEAIDEPLLQPKGESADTEAM